MKERGILFSGPMVRAILEGRKTQTRRVMKPQPWYGSQVPGGAHYIWPPGSGQRFNEGADIQRMVTKCPHGQPGDRLWVRESFAVMNADGLIVPRRTHAIYEDDQVVHRADVPNELHDDPGKIKVWRPSIHMPRWASRILLEVVSVRVERLNEISEADCAAEGIREVTKDGKVAKFCVYDRGDMSSVAWSDMPRDPRAAFAKFWEVMHGPGSWAQNPWVWVVEFKKL